jgi:hypothetical protein
VRAAILTRLRAAASDAAALCPLSLVPSPHSTASRATAASSWAGTPSAAWASRCDRMRAVRPSHDCGPPVRPLPNPVCGRLRGSRARVPWLVCTPSPLAPDPQWIREMGVRRLPGGAQQPFYTVLVSDARRDEPAEPPRSRQPQPPSGAAAAAVGVAAAAAAGVAAATEAGDSDSGGAAAGGGGVPELLTWAPFGSAGAPASVFAAGHAASRGVSWALVLTCVRVTALHESVGSRSRSRAQPLAVAASAALTGACATASPRGSPRRLLCPRAKPHADPKRAAAMCARI